MSCRVSFALAFKAPSLGAAVRLFLLFRYLRRLRFFLAFALEGQLTQRMRRGCGVSFRQHAVVLALGSNGPLPKNSGYGAGPLVAGPYCGFGRVEEWKCLIRQP